MSSSAALASGLPCSMVRVLARPSGLDCSAAAHSCSTLRRTSISRLQAGYAFWAASKAWSSSALLQSGTWAKTLPVAGLITPTVFDPFTGLPLMVMVYCSAIFECSCGWGHGKSAPVLVSYNASCDRRKPSGPRNQHGSVSGRRSAKTARAVSARSGGARGENEDHHQDHQRADDANP